jgi:hypothetical protein
MHKPYKLYTCLVVIFSLLALAGCSPNPAAPTPTIEPSATPAPSDTPVPTDTPQPTLTLEPTNPPALTGTAAGQTALTPAAATQASAATLPAVTQAQSLADQAQFVTQNFPDGYRFTPGTSVTIIWTVKNIGTTGWTTSYTLRYFAGEKGTKTSYAFPKTVPPNATVNLSVTFVVPSALGTYSTWWKLANGEGRNFSDVDFKFESAETAGPPRPSPTP